MNFRVVKNLKFSTTYKQCQSNLLREEIHQKKSTVQILQKEFTSLKASLQNELNLTDFTYASTCFFGINDKILKSKSLVKQKKKTFCKLVYENKMENGPEKVIFNFSKYELSDAEMKLLAKCLNFCPAPKQLSFYILS